MTTRAIPVPRFITTSLETFDRLADQAVSFLLNKSTGERVQQTVMSPFGRLFNKNLPLLERNKEYLKTAIKVALVMVAFVAAYAIYCHPYLMLASVLAGVCVSLEEETKKSLASWLKDFRAKVITPILENETPVERVAIALLAACVTTIAATTIIVPSATGVLLGVYIRQYLTGKKA